jgi:hypothetical protein
VGQPNIFDRRFGRMKEKKVFAANWHGLKEQFSLVFNSSKKSLDSNICKILFKKYYLTDKCY